MWPKRKIQLVASSATPGIDGVRALLKGIQLEFSEVEPNAEGLCGASSECWVEKPFLEMCKSSDWDPVTELVYWPGELEDNFWRKWASAQGIKQQPIQEFIHNLLQDEQVLWISEPMVFLEGRPLLGHILEYAGFEPSILWLKANGEWDCERKQGLHWLIPESWLEGLADKCRSLGMDVPMAHWVVRETQVDFYRSSEGQGYLGRMLRWPDPSDEPLVYQTIAKCLDMGVSWLDIGLALESLSRNIQMGDNSRWKINDFGWNDGTRGEKISTPSTEHMEDWWARRNCILA